MPIFIMEPRVGILRCLGRSGCGQSSESPGKPYGTRARRETPDPRKVRLPQLPLVVVADVRRLPLRAPVARIASICCRLERPHVSEDTRTLLK